jgi:hypothetical protein
MSLIYELWWLAIVWLVKCVSHLCYLSLLYAVCIHEYIYGNSKYILHYYQLTSSDMVCLLLRAWTTSWVRVIWVRMGLDTKLNPWRATSFLMDRFWACLAGLLTGSGSCEGALPNAFREELFFNKKQRNRSRSRFEGVAPPKWLWLIWRSPLRGAMPNTPFIFASIGLGWQNPTRRHLHMCQCDSTCAYLGFHRESKWRW